MYDDNDLREREEIAPNFEQEFGGDFDPKEKAGFESGEKAPAKNDQSQEGTSSSTKKGDSPGSKEPGFVFKTGRSIGQKKSRLKKWQKRSLWGAVVSGAGVGIALFIIFLSTLLIPHFMSNVIGWQFASVARDVRQANENVLAEKTAIDTVDDSTYSALRDKFAGVRNTWDDYAVKLQPRKLLENMQAEGRIEYNYSKPKGIFRRTKLESVTVDGEQIPADFNNGTFSKFFPKNRAGQLELAGELKTNIDGSLGDYGPLIRGRVFSKMLDELDIKLHFWNKLGADYENTSEQEADRQVLREEVKAIDGEPVTGSSSDLNDAAKKAQETEQKCLANDTCTDQVINDPNTLAKAEVDSIETATKGSLFKNVLGFLSTTYAIAMPACIVYDASVENSGNTVDLNDGNSQRSFITYASIGDEQKSGKLATVAGVAAAGRRLGSVGQSIPQVRQAGQAVDQSKIISPQASAGGTYSLLNVIFPGPGADFVNSFAPRLCSKLTDIRTATAVATAELALGALTGGASEAEEQTALRSMTLYFKNFSSELFSKHFAKKLVLQAALIGGGSLLAKYVTLQHVGQNTSATNNHQDLSINVDVGANITAGQLCQRQQACRPLSKEEVAQTTEANIAFLNSQNSNLSVGQRYFAASNPNSLVSKIGLSMANMSWQRTFSDLISNIGSIFNFKPLLALLSNPLTSSPAYAASTTDQYPVVQWGWSETEMSTIDSNPTYHSPLRNAKVLQDSGRLDSIAHKYDKCFTATMGQLLSGQSPAINRDTDGMAADSNSDCSPVSLGMHNPQFGDLVFRYRLKKRYDNTMIQFTDVQNAGEASPGSQQVASSSGSSCAQGTTDLGMNDGYKGGQKVSVHLCAIPNIASSGQESVPGNSYYVQGANGHAVVNSEMSANFLNLANAAASDGIQLAASSSFRTMAHQESLCPCNGVTIAHPGFSNHQMGYAIDFVMPSRSNSTSNCTRVGGRCEAPGDPVWEWMNSDATRFGVMPYVNEFWHWSKDGH